MIDNLFGEPLEQFLKSDRFKFVCQHYKKFNEAEKHFFVEGLKAKGGLLNNEQIEFLLELIKKHG